MRRPVVTCIAFVAVCRTGTTFAFLQANSLSKCSSKRFEDVTAASSLDAAAEIEASQEPRRRLFIFGLGYTGAAVAELAAKSGFEVCGTCARDRAAEIADSCGGGIRVYRFAGGAPLSGDARAALLAATHVLSTVPPTECDGSDPVLTTHAADLTAAAPAGAERKEWVGYLSSTGVYGDHQGGWVDESIEPKPVSRKGATRLAAEGQWRALAALGAPVHVFRLAGIYGPGRSALQTLRRRRAAAREAAAASTAVAASVSEAAAEETTAPNAQTGGSDSGIGAVRSYCVGGSTVTAATAVAKAEAADAAAAMAVDAAADARVPGIADGETPLSRIHVADVAQLLVGVSMLRPSPGLVLNLADALPATRREVFGYAAALLAGGDGSAQASTAAESAPAAASKAANKAAATATRTAAGTAAMAATAAATAVGTMAVAAVAEEAAGTNGRYSSSRGGGSKRVDASVMHRLLAQAGLYLLFPDFRVGFDAEIAAASHGSGAASATTAAVAAGTGTRIAAAAAVAFENDAAAAMVAGADASAAALAAFETAIRTSNLQQ